MVSSRAFRRRRTRRRRFSRLAPGWLQGLSDANPHLYAVDAERALFAGDLADLAVVKGFAVIGCLAVVTVALAVREFHEDGSSVVPVLFAIVR